MNKTNISTVSLRTLPIGSIDERVDQILKLIHSVRYKSQVIIFPELTLTGYPPKDILYDISLYDTISNKLLYISNNIPDDMIVIIGAPIYNKSTKNVFNSACILQKGNISYVHKRYLPNYNIFEEQRYFTPQIDQTPILLNINNIKFGILICEDLWVNNAIKDLLRYGVDGILVLNASPYEYGKLQRKIEMVKTRARDYRIYIAYSNWCGGQDEICYDGYSFIVDPYGNIITDTEPFSNDESKIATATIYKDVADKAYMLDGRIKVSNRI